ncbi:hypothetical protein CHH83_12175 [Bacillus sp. 7586-K]|uniref:hypothetical protein n=1 Tax=Metabacillus niabensis TaxID=324854 RepID=UPI000BA75EBE|nr:hypothetical protein CHH83_12175 [Bacillus sp. 7586-K]
MNRIIIVIAFILTMILSTEANAQFKVPETKETDHWKIELLEPSKNEALAQAKKGKYEVYSLLVTNKGNEVYNVEVEAFRNGENDNKMYGLAPQFEHPHMQAGDTLQFSNFPVKTKTEKVEFVITWEDTPITLKDGTKVFGRKFKETISFLKS